MKNTFKVLVMLVTNSQSGKNLSSYDIQRTLGLSDSEAQKIMNDLVLEDVAGWSLTQSNTIFYKFGFLNS